VLSGRGLYDELITRPEESYRLWCVVCDLENLKNEVMTRVGLQRHWNKKIYICRCVCVCVYIYVSWLSFVNQSCASSGDSELCRLSSGWITSPLLSEFGGS
jgi:hypothetical protein